MSDPGDHWQRKIIAGAVCDFFAPPDPQAVLIFLHGMSGDTLAGNRHWTRLAAEHRVQIVAPQGAFLEEADSPGPLDHTNAPYCWWMDVGEMPLVSGMNPSLSPEMWLVRQLQPALAATGLPVALAGEEVGGHGALRTAYRHARQFPIVMAVAPKVDVHNIHGLGASLDRLYDTAEDVRQQEATVWLHPLDRPRFQLILCDPANEFCFPGCQTLLTKLSSTGCPHEADISPRMFDAGTTERDAAAPRFFSFLMDATLRMSLE
jgi:S-formylglutathione hydrolase